MDDRDLSGSLLGSVLADVLKRIDPDHRLKAFEVWTFWDEVVGDALARRAQPSGFRNGVLFVTVGAHAWIQELQFMKDDLIRRINDRLGERMIRDIYLVSGSVAQPGAKRDLQPAAKPAQTSARLGKSAGSGDTPVTDAPERVLKARARPGFRATSKPRRPRAKD